MPLISVVIPVYNAEKSLRRCVDSFLSQTFEDFEILLINDGSLDASEKICAEYADNYGNIRTYTIENNGVSAARNYGVSKARGEYIVFTDSDDFVQPDYLSELSKPVLAGFSLALCGFNYVDDYSGKNKKPAIPDETAEYTVANKNMLYKLCSPPFISQPWNKIFRKEIIDKYNMKMPENMSLGEDMLFNFEYLDKIIDEDFYIINKPLYNYYTSSPVSLLNRYRKDLWEINTAINKSILGYIDKWLVEEETATGFKNDAFVRLENALFNTFNKANNDTLSQKLRYNRHLMKSPEFTEAYKSYTGGRNIVFRLSYAVKSFLPVYLMCRMKGSL